MEKKKYLRVLSLGAGVQSSTLALMIEKGEIPMVDCAIFSDTMAEPKAVYEWLEYLQKQVSYPIYKVQRGNLKQDMINAVDGGNKFLVIPLYTVNSSTGKKGLLMRQCTNDYKIQPINKKIRELLNVGYRQRVLKDTKVELVMGISYDEMVRMKTNRLPYIENQYPLVDKKIRRKDCIDWMTTNNYPKPPRSACTFCPYHTNEEWLKIKENDEEWKEVVELDKFIRNGTRKPEEQVFLHRDCVPIDEVDFKKEQDKKEQLSLLDECEGMCGI